MNVAESVPLSLGIKKLNIYRTKATKYKLGNQGIIYFPSKYLITNCAHSLISNAIFVVMHCLQKKKKIFSNRPEISYSID